MHSKRENDDVGGARPAKKARLILEEDSSDDYDDQDDAQHDDYLGASPPRDYLKINEEYAKRFEHNKKREDQQRCKMHPNPPLQFLGKC